VRSETTARRIPSTDTAVALLSQVSDHASLREGKVSRSDLHRPGAIVPADYSPVLAYALATTVDGWPQPSWNIDRVVELRRDPAVKWAASGTTGNCSVCGSSFTYGEIWKHEPSGEHIHLGHICAGKYELLADWSELEAFRAEQKRLRASQIERKLYAEQRTAFLAAHPGLEDAFALCKTDRESRPFILLDLESKFQKFRNLSEKQVALALKIADEVRNPKPEEPKVEAPEGRIEIRGTVVSCKERPGYAYGTYEWKVTIKVQEQDGIWLGWLTLPQAAQDRYHELLNEAREARYAKYDELKASGLKDDELLKAGDEVTNTSLGFPEAGDLCGWIKGQQVEVKATFKRSDRDAHFAFGKRPTGWAFVTEAK